MAARLDGVPQLGKEALELAHLRSPMAPAQVFQLGHEADSERVELPAALGQPHKLARPSVGSLTRST